MAARVLLDTNVLVYAADAPDTVKQPRALATLIAVQELQIGALSVQCLTEFYSVVTRKFDPPMPAQRASAQVMWMADSFAILGVTTAVVMEALRGTIQHQMSIWDAQIWAVARLNQIAVILTEDGHHNRTVEGVRYLNPFLVDDLTGDVLIGLLGL